MIHLIYVSSARELFSAEQLQVLLAKSRANNAGHGITGMLLHKDGNFMQALEGEEEAVLALHGKIARDPRHHDVITILKGPLVERHFSDWSMGFGDLNDAGASLPPGYSDFMQTPLTARAFAPNTANSLRLLMMFKRNMQ